MLTIINGRPGLLRDLNTGQIFNMAEFAPWETSARISGMSWDDVFQEATDLVLEGWRFTVPVWPKNGVEVQQRVILKVGAKTVAKRSLSSLLTSVERIEPNVSTAADRYSRNMKAEQLTTETGFIVRSGYMIRVELEERPVETGLRLHFYGRTRTLSY